MKTKLQVSKNVTINKPDVKRQGMKVRTVVTGHDAIFDTFANEAGRNAHLTGEIAKALTARASELFAVPPQVEKVEVLANTPLKV